MKVFSRQNHNPLAPPAAVCLHWLVRRELAQSEDPRRFLHDPERNPVSTLS
jgi:hypothetical protein